MAVPNQKTITIHRTDFDKDKVFIIRNLDKEKKAMNNLPGNLYKMWAYLAKNKDSFDLELSVADAKDWGIKKDAYYTAIKGLQEAGYLEEENGVWHFYEDVDDKGDSGSQKITISSGSQNISGSQTETISKVFSGKPNITKNDLFMDFSGSQNDSGNQKILEKNSQVNSGSQKEFSGSQKNLSSISSGSQKDFSGKPRRNNIYKNNIDNKINNTMEFSEELPLITMGDIIIGNMEYETVVAEKGIIKLKETGELRQLERIDASYF